jgi:hypothetical protein
LPWLALGGSLVAAEEPVPDPAATVPLRYRKVFIPSESLRNPDFAGLKNEAFVPVRREEFDRLLGAAGT